MNGFLWLGLASTAVLVAAILFDGLDEIFDVFDLGSPWLSLPVVAAFVAAFGYGTGATVDSLGLLAVLVGVAAGVVFAFGAARLSVGAMQMRTDPTDSQADLLASFGRIVTAPSGERYGEVLLHRPAGPVKVSCIADRTIPAGTEVIVVDVTSSTLVTVEPFEPEPDLDPPSRSTPK